MLRLDSRRPRRPHPRPALRPGGSRRACAAKYGYDEPIYVQYVKYMENLAHGDLGVSTLHTDFTRQRRHPPEDLGLHPD